MKIKSTLVAFAAFSVLAAGSGRAALVFTEDFGSLADGTDISTSNTNLTYVRIGTGGGVIDAKAPGSFGTGSSAIVTQSTSSTSLNGIGVQSTLTSSTIYTLTMDFRATNLAGDFIIGVGSGAAFTGNGTFSTAQGLFWLQSNNGNLERRTSSAWTNVGASATTLALNTNYSLAVVANGSASPIVYGSSSVGAGKMDIYLNGTLIDDDVDVTTSGLSANGFRMYNISQGDFEIDNISLFNSAEAIPEPSTALLGAIGALALLRRRR